MKVLGINNGILKLLLFSFLGRFQFWLFSGLVGTFFVLQGMFTMITDFERDRSSPETTSEAAIMSSDERADLVLVERPQATEVAWKLLEFFFVTK